MRPRNPFTPTFGTPPPLLVGRQDLIDDFADGLDEGPGSPGRATLYTGVRGVGKTVMLNEAEDQARTRGWLVISETATPGLLDRLTHDHLPRLLAEHGSGGAGRRSLVGVNVPAIAGVTFAPAPEPRLDFRRQLEVLTDVLAGRGTGLLITVDELHRHLRDDLRIIGAVVQHAFRETRELAFAGAGLPAAVSGLLNDEVLTFLRRADRHTLGPVDGLEVAAAIGQPIRDAGRVISGELCTAAAEATNGYPFLIQLIGYHVWRQNPDAQEVTTADVAAGVAAARRRIGSLVLEPSLADLSQVDRSFLVAMAQDDGPSRLADVAQRLGVKLNYASQYRLRLIGAELIEPASRGELVFTMPYLREYLRDHAASLGLA